MKKASTGYDVIKVVSLNFSTGKLFWELIMFKFVIHKFEVENYGIGFTRDYIFQVQFMVGILGGKGY